MSATITFVDSPKINSITPDYGLYGAPFMIDGSGLQHVTGVQFQNMFQDILPATHTVMSDTQISGAVPMVDGTLGYHKVIVQNGAGNDGLCCFRPIVPVQLQVTRRLIQYRYRQITDRYGINSSITNTPNKYQGHEVENIVVQPMSSSNTLEITCEISLESSYWGGAVVALFKGNETYPVKVWDFALLGEGMGTIAKLTYLVEASSTDSQTWRVRVGKSENSYATIYINRTLTHSVPFMGYTSSFISIKEIEGIGII